MSMISQRSKLNEHNNKGFTLIELMIAILLGMLIVGAITTIYIATIRSSSNTVKSAKLNHDLGTTALLMVNDIRRAGYWGDAVTTSEPKDNPFMQGTANIQIPTSSCIVYTYDGGANLDADNDPNSNGIVDSDEYYGFKLNNNTIQMKLSGSTTANCTDGVWVDLLDSDDIDITGLIFSFVTDANIENVTATSRCLNASDTTESANKDCTSAIADGDISSGEIVETRQVLYEITGTLDDDNTVTKVISGSVKVRNDRIFTQP